MKSVAPGPSISPVEVTNVSHMGSGSSSASASCSSRSETSRGSKRRQSERLRRWNFRARIICTGLSWTWISPSSPLSILKNIRW